MKFHRLLFVIASMLWMSAFAQRLPDLGPLNVTVKVTPPVQGLTYDATLGQIATFIVVATTDAPPNTKVSYTWTGPGLTFADPHARSTLATAFGPGQFEPDCTASTKWQTGGNGSAPCYAIGGPLLPSVEAGIGGTPAHDDGGALSWFIEYFGYDPSQAKPAYSQGTQNGHLEAYPGQVITVGYEWQMPGGTVLLTPGVVSGVNGPVRQISFGATAESGLAALRAKLIYHLYFNGSDWPYPDDSDATPPGASFYKFTAHKPTTSSVFSKDTVLNVQGPTTWSWGDDYLILVNDNLGVGMPAVWMNEYYPSPPASFTINGDNYPGWTTSGAGVFGIDHLWVLNWPVPMPSSGPPVFDTTHLYMAGTRSNRGPGFGISVGTYHIQIWTNQTSHIGS